MVILVNMLILKRKRWMTFSTGNLPISLFLNHYFSIQHFFSFHFSFRVLSTASTDVVLMELLKTKSQTATESSSSNVYFFYDELNGFWSAELVRVLCFAKQWCPSLACSLHWKEHQIAHTVKSFPVNLAWIMRVQHKSIVKMASNGKGETAR